MLIDIASAVGGYLHEVFLGNADWGILICYVAQILFAMRFVVQWIASERAGKSVVPTAFWVFSIGGGLMLLGYALYRKDPVFIIGQAFGVFVYLRNLQFVIRSVGPPGAHLVAVRYSLQSNTITRLSKPPHEKPIPNSASSFMKACTDFSGVGLSTMLNSPQAPEKSSCQILWPGSLSSAGCSTRKTSGRCSSQRATRRPDSLWRASRTPSVRKPRNARYMSSGPTHRPMVCTTVLSAGSVLAFADTQPNMMSEWPPIYLVPAWIDRSTPFSKARK